MRRGRDRDYLVPNIIHVYSIAFFGKDAAFREVGGIANHHAVVLADNIAHHVILFRKHLVIEDFRDLFVVIFGFHAKHNHITRRRVFAHGGGIFDETLTPGLTAGEDDQGGWAFAEVIFFLQPFQVEHFFIRFPVRRNRHIGHAHRDQVRDRRAGFVHIVKVTPVDLFYHALCQVGTQRRKAFVGKRVQLLVQLLIHRHGLLLALFEFGHVEVSAVGVLYPVLFQKGVMHTDPDQVSLDRGLSECHAVGSVARHVILKQVGHIIPVVGMDRGVQLPALIADALFFRPLHHLRVLAGTPNRIIVPVVLDAHQDRVIVQRAEQLCIETRLKIQHSSYLFHALKSAKL